MDAGLVFRVIAFAELMTPARCRHPAADLLLVMVTRLLLYKHTEYRCMTFRIMLR